MRVQIIWWAYKTRKTGKRFLIDAWPRKKYYNTIQSGQNYVCVRLNGSLYVVEICTMCFIHSDVSIFRNQWIISSLSLISYCTPWYRWLVWTCEISQQVKSSFSDNKWCVLIKDIHNNFLWYNEDVKYRNGQLTH